ncbi:hypothetical protein N0V88_000717 [Collariella sp. IMI 366227]|nr:hypothetical protein N0V88_000717 [Collariella sp. IMI 366227]
MFGGVNGRSGNTGVFRGPLRQTRKPPTGARAVAAGIPGAPRPVYRPTRTNGQTGISGPMPESLGFSGHDVAAAAATSVLASVGNPQLSQAAYYRSTGSESANGQPDEHDLASLHNEMVTMSNQVAFQFTCMLEHMQDLKNVMSDLKIQMDDFKNHAAANQKTGRNPLWTTLMGVSGK